MEFQEPTGVGAPSSFLRARTDRWLADAAIAAGAELRAGHVDRLMTAGSEVQGIVLDGVARPASVTILADGPRAADLAEGLSPARPAGGDRRTILTERWALAGARLAERFDLPDGAGCSIHAILGATPSHQLASGFLVTHSDSLTVGVLSSGEPSGLPALLDSFRAHPSIAPFLAGTTPIPGSARTTPERPPRSHLAGPGWLLAGDSAGLRDFHGAVLRGRNRALRSGWLAGSEAAAAGAARGAGARYRRHLRSEQLVEGGPSSRDPLIGDPRIHGAYPDLLAVAFHRLMTETGRPKEPVTRALRTIRRSSGRSWPALLRDATGAVRRL